MKTSEKKQLAESSVAELMKKATELKRQIVEATYKRTHESVKNVRFIAGMRKKLGLMLTLIRQKGLATER